MSDTSLLLLAFTWMLLLATLVAFLLAGLKFSRTHSFVAAAIEAICAVAAGAVIADGGGAWGWPTLSVAALLAGLMSLVGMAAGENR
jgi:hypothetical protein